MHKAPIGMELGPEYEQGGDVINHYRLKLGECLDSILQKLGHSLVPERQACKTDWGRDHRCGVPLYCHNNK